MPGMTKTALQEEMLSAARSIFKDQWAAMDAFATPEFEKLALTILQIQSLTADDLIGESEALVILEMQKHTARGVMMSREGAGLKKVDLAINSGLGMVKNTVNTALGFPLI